MFEVPKIFNPYRPVYLIGGGTSFRRHLGATTMNDLAIKASAALKGKQSIAINTAYRIVPRADIFFFGDDCFYHQYRDRNPEDDFFQFEGKYIITTSPPLHGKIPDHIQWLDRHKGKGRIFSIDPKYMGTWDGKLKNSGFQSINLAYLAGAKKIVLLGYDCLNVNGATHWHSGTHLSHNNGPDDAALRRHALEFAQLSEHLKANRIDIEIINACPESAIQCWDKITIEEAFALDGKQ